MIVETWMTRNPIVVAPETSIGEAATTMIKAGIRHLPVVRDGELIGILARSDLLRGRELDPFAIGNQSSHLLRGEVRHIMTTKVLTVGPATPLEDAAQLMVEHKIGTLPVVRDKGALVGILSESDAMRALIESIEMPGPGVRLTFETPNPDALIKFLVERTATLNLHIASVMVRHVGFGLEVIAKISGDRSERLVDASWAAGHRLRNVTRTFDVHIDSASR